MSRRRESQPALTSHVSSGVGFSGRSGTSCSSRNPQPKCTKSALTFLSATHTSFAYWSVVDFVWAGGGTKASSRPTPTSFGAFFCTYPPH